MPSFFLSQPTTRTVKGVASTSQPTLRRHVDRGDFLDANQVDAEQHADKRAQNEVAGAKLAFGGWTLGHEPSDATKGA